MGSRTVERVTRNISGTPAMTQKSGRAKVNTKFCKAVCDFLCKSRDGMIMSLVQPIPAWEDIIRDYTDYKTLIDMKKGASCVCKCGMKDQDKKSMIDAIKKNLPYVPEGGDEEIDMREALAGVQD